MIPFRCFSGHFTDPFLSGVIGVFFARKMHSTSEFAKIVLSKCVCVWETLNQREKQGARGRIDGTGQRRPIYVVVKTYLHPKWQGGQAKNHPNRHIMTWHDMTWHANVTTRHGGYHFISFHPLHYGVYQSVCGCGCGCVRHTCRYIYIYIYIYSCTYVCKHMCSV